MSWNLLSGIKNMVFTKATHSKLIQKNSKPMNIIAYTDNQSLHDTVHSTKQTVERRLIVGISFIREMVDNNQIQIIWVKKDKQISDVLTKSGVSQKSLLSILETGKILSMYFNTYFVYVLFIFKKNCRRIAFIDLYIYNLYTIRYTTYTTLLDLYIVLQKIHSLLLNSIPEYIHQTFITDS